MIFDQLHHEYRRPIPTPILRGDSRKSLDFLFVNTAFNLRKTLAPFLPSESIELSREMLQVTGGIISGSVALQFLDRTAFSSSDLDAYKHPPLVF